MRYSFILPALFATTFAAPAVKYVTQVEVVHVTVTAGAAQPAATQAASYQVAAPPKAKHQHGHQHKHTTTKAAAPVIKTVTQEASPPETYAAQPPTEQQPEPTSEAAPAPVETSSAAPAPQPTTSEAAAPVSSTPASDNSGAGTNSEGIPTYNGVSVLDVYNKWRGKFGIAPATWSQSLADNAYETGKGGNGVEQKHILPTLTKPGSCAQVITPGSNIEEDGYDGNTPFDIAMLSWLCEVQTDSETSADCPMAMKANGMTYVDTAHHDDLVNTEYTQVGIAFYPNPNPTEGTPWKGLWVASLES